MRDLRADLYGKLVAVKAAVVRVSNAKPLCLTLAFQCRICEGITLGQQVDGKYTPPARCSANKEGSNNSIA